MSPPRIAPAVALRRLREGNDRYRTDCLRAAADNGRGQVRRDSTGGIQAPWAVVLTCVDSRVTPELIFDAGIGELFVVRVGGNIANTSSIASIEFAVMNLEVSLILVLGHGSCGAILAAMHDIEAGHNMNHLLAHLKPAVRAVRGDVRKAEDVERCVRKNAEIQAKELLGRSTILSNSVAAGAVKVISGYYHLSGKVDLPVLV